MGGATRKSEKGTMAVYADTFVPNPEQEKAAFRTRRRARLASQAIHGGSVRRPAKSLI
jgi:antirestriction protein ArdC